MPSAALAFQPERALTLVSGSTRRLSNAQPDPAGWDDRRASVRRTLSELSWLNRVRLKYGPCVSLIDLSAGGLQIETGSYPLQPGGTVVVEMETDGQTLNVPSRVVRAYVTGLFPTISYRSALSFRRPISLPDPPRVGDSPNEPGLLLHEHAKLSVALRTLDESPFLWGTQPKGVARVGQSALAASLAIMESPAGRRAGALFSREMARLLRVLHGGITSGASSDVMLADLMEAIRRGVPAQVIRMVPEGAISGTPDAICFTVPSADGRSAGQLVVELARTGRLEPWHLSFLKAAAHLITVVNQVAAVTRAREQSLSSAATSELPGGWKRLVIRYLDGRVLKGYNTRFAPATGHVHIWMTPGGPDTSRITVSLRHLKALFFVHDLAGDPSHVVRDGADGPTEPGRRVDVTFLDGETLAGLTLNYSAQAVGFFVAPVDSTGNNLQIFAVADAVRQVAFP